MNRQGHWDSVYVTKDVAEVGWYQAEPKMSLDLIEWACPGHGGVIDVGGGASVLVDRLLDARFQKVAVLDISAAALERAKSRLGERAERVQWVVGDVTAVEAVGKFDVWHDRAVFHFLTNRADRERYAALLTRTVPPGGHAVIATFAPDGPAKCSGLEVARYDGQGVARELGPGLALLKTVPEVHVTPRGARQSFQYSVFTRTQEALP